MRADDTRFERKLCATCHQWHPVISGVPHRIEGACERFVPANMEDEQPFIQRPRTGMYWLGCRGAVHNAADDQYQTMTDTQQAESLRVRLAEKLGWTQGEPVTLLFLVRQAEKEMPESIRRKYGKAVSEAVAPKGAKLFGGRAFLLITASPEARATALLEVMADSGASRR